MLFQFTNKELDLMTNIHRIMLMMNEDNTWLGFIEAAKRTQPKRIVVILNFKLLYQYYTDRAYFNKIVNEWFKLYDPTHDTWTHKWKAESSKWINKMQATGLDGYETSSVIAKLQAYLAKLLDPYEFYIKKETAIEKEVDPVHFVNAWVIPAINKSNFMSYDNNLEGRLYGYLLNEETAMFTHFEQGTRSKINATLNTNCCVNINKLINFLECMPIEYTIKLEHDINKQHEASNKFFLAIEKVLKDS